MLLLTHAGIVQLRDNEGHLIECVQDIVGQIAGCFINLVDEHNRSCGCTGMNHVGGQQVFELVARVAVNDRRPRALYWKYGPPRQFASHPGRLDALEAFWSFQMPTLELGYMELRPRVERIE